LDENSANQRAATAELWAAARANYRRIEELSFYMTELVPEFMIRLTQAFNESFELQIAQRHTLTGIG
jgi:hypothetical protein